MRRYLLGILIALVAASCSSSSSGGGSKGDGTGDGEDEASGSLTEFVTDLIEHKTVDEMRPMDEGVFAALPDPDAETNNSAAYLHLF